MGSVRPRRPPNQAAYYVALAGILVLLALLCCYFFYFCITKVKQLTSEPDPSSRPVTSSTTSTATSYPVQPGVRDSATAMVKLCKQLPPSKGDTIFPTSTSPEAQLASDTTHTNVPDQIDRQTNKIEPVCMSGGGDTEAVR